ncbi:MAG: hypothetical protein A3D31_06520 [Candidatus Fluviicola riflensis]|nr:MAG: hypothetical protein CHH17_08490 [Candidatus Fluviicola riflensis]OGS79615.1 MAG: hypothetical protein A3D31_06520 [Candidatus Fluviicola riflensis]OGS87046.1 MAG: hypothetical protein A2724_05980 [Fluviicola sp. RIFCSPHIGHO2_01_FULL_43_53]OGS89838.1 MAG: hypothetical protein A3E30_02730 [Fluviicola sp. RIFCSPHIGHO2_12_FULL_43_24]
MKTHTLLLLTCIYLLFAGCASEIPATDPIFDNDTPLKKRIQLALDKSYLNELGIDDENAELITEFYKSRGYKPLWANDSTLTGLGQKMDTILSKPNCIGIPNNRWKKSDKKQKEIIAKELLLTAKLGFAANDLHNGLLDTAKQAMKPLVWSRLNNWDKQLDTVSNWGYWFAQMGDFRNDYKQLAIGLFDFAYNRSFSDQNFDLPTMKEDSTRCYSLAKESLIDKGYLEKDAVDTVFLNALETFQVDNGLKPDAVIGNYTRKALEESEQTKVDRVILSMERWRWREKYADRYIWINIPEYMLRLYYNDSLLSQHRVVVGKIDTKTPQLESKITSIISYPYWTVPYSITSKEILPALKQNPGYLAKNHYKLFKGDVEIDPYSVNWKKIPKNTFPYKVRQEPGTWNSLGIIKFEFSNPFGVYVHDTPSKGLFGTDVRSYSHGCIRCNLPDSLARFILRRDNQRITTDSLDSMIYKEQHRSIRLKKSVQIKVDYITVAATPDGKLIFHPDIYGRDAAYLKWFSKS